MAAKFIQKAIKHPGALHKQLSVPEGQKIPAGKLRAAAKKGGKLGQRARFAMTLKHITAKHKHDRKGVMSHKDKAYHIARGHMMLRKD